MATQMEEVFKEELSKQFYDVVHRVVVSEKTTRQMEFENKLVFEVARQASKPMIKLLMEQEFNRPVKSVNTVNTVKGKKRAVVTFKEDGAASDLAADLGLV